MSNDPRWIAGKHLTLTDDGLLPFITRIKGDVVPSFAVWRELCAEARELIAAGELPEGMLIQVRAVEKFLVDHLMLSVSVGGEGRRELVEAIKALNEEALHRDAASASQSLQQRSGGLRP